jgi:hypothetical protein
LNVPAVASWSDALWSFGRARVRGPPLTKAALCCALSRFVQVTLSPALIVTVGGSNANPAMLTLALAPAAVDASAMNRSPDATIARLAARVFIDGEAARRRA